MQVIIIQPYKFRASLLVELKIYLSFVKRHLQMLMRKSIVLAPIAPIIFGGCKMRRTFISNGPI